MYTDDRIRVVDDGKELIVRSVGVEDRGDWTCTVQLKQAPVSLTHKLEILVAPSVSLMHTKVCHSLSDIDFVLKLCNNF